MNSHLSQTENQLFKYMDMKMSENQTSLIFVINGEKFELSSVEPSTTLLEFLRNQTRFKSVKLGCGEGGCGACVVLISKYDPLLDRVDDFTASSCLTLLCSIHGCSITTSEGIGNSKQGFHPIHQRFAGFHASQCGFCTPGMCVSLFGALVKADESDSPEPPAGFSKINVSDAEKSIANNLCRCTGYRPIADVCKSFAADVDMEDLGLNSFWRKGDSKDEKISKLPRYDRDHDHKTIEFPMFLKEVSHDLLIASEKHYWLKPTTLEELRRLIELNRGNKTKIKIVSHNTAMGYYKDRQGYDKYIDISGISELLKIKKDQSGIEIGAAVTISKAIEVLREENRGDFISDYVMILQKIADHMNKVATVFVRNTASVGGNLVIAQKNMFPSDIATILLAVDSKVHIMTGSKFKWIALKEFLESPPLAFESVLLSIKIPCLESSASRSRFVYETYRASPRPLGNALAYLNAAFLVQVSSCKDSHGTMIDTCRLAFGGFMNKRAVRAKSVEKFLVGKLLSVRNLYDAINLLKASATVIPQDETSESAYISSLAVGFLFQFFNSLIDSSARINDDYFNGYTHLPSVEASKIRENQNQVHPNKSPTLLMSGKQVIVPGSEYSPIGKPVVKSGAVLQASGEAVFVDDIPSPKNCLHGAYIYSQKPLARITSIKLRQELELDGVRGILSSKDIPNGGDNIGAKTFFGKETIFAEEIAICVGDRLAFVVADTQKLADFAANTASVEYSIENLEPPILSVEDAVKRSSFFEVPPSYQPKNQIGDISKGMAEADHKIVSSKMKLPSQYHFYMETQTALAIPDEDNCITVYSSSQNPEYVHSTIARCLGIPENNVRVITRRVGGAYGGKSLKSIAGAVSCALAAHKLQRPVRMYLNRKTDMLMIGGRHPMKITYSAGFKNNGKLTALHLEVLVDAGIYPDVSAVIPQKLVSAIKKYDWGAFSFDIKVCKTNLPSRTIMRAPGDMQGSFIAEAIIEKVAATLSMEVDSVRSINLHKYTSLKKFYEDSSGELLEYTLPLIWDKISVSANYELRVNKVKEFNHVNIWNKRGISRVPVVYELNVKPAAGKVSILSDGSVAVECGGIELGQGLWTKVKQMAAFALGTILSNGSGSLLDKVRIIQADTLSLIQGGATADSTTSEASSEAVRLSCNILVERLKPIAKKLQEESSSSIKWEDLILQAYNQAVNLSASSYFVPSNTSVNYLNYGAAVSEVEIDLLTGETSFLQTDIIYDCGQSLNPAVDLGQIEGSFIQGLGFLMLEEYETNLEGLVLEDGTWNYKIPTIDTIPQQLNVEIINSDHHKQRVLSSKASGEPPLLLAASVHCATRSAVKEARKQLQSWSNLDESDSTLQLGVPATMHVVKEIIGLDIVERYLKWKMGNK